MTRSPKSWISPFLTHLKVEHIHSQQTESCLNHLIKKPSLYLSRDFLVLLVLLHFFVCFFFVCLSDLCRHLVWVGEMRWSTMVSPMKLPCGAFTLLTSDLTFLVLPQLCHTTGCKRSKLTCTITFRVLYLYSSRQQWIVHCSHRKSESWNTYIH